MRDFRLQPRSGRNFFRDMIFGMSDMLQPETQIGIERSILNDIPFLK